MLIYAAIAFVGFVFLLVMLFVGELFGGDHDLGGHDGGIEHAVGDHGGPSVFSARIMAAFLTAFGVGGVVGRYYDLSHPAASGVGIATGVVMAGLVYQFAKILYSQQASSEVQMIAPRRPVRRSVGGDSGRRRRPGLAERRRRAERAHRALGGRRAVAARRGGRHHRRSAAIR